MAKKNPTRTMRRKFKRNESEFQIDESCGVGNHTRWSAMKLAEVPPPTGGDVN